MLKQPSSKYKAFQPIGLTDRRWPDRVLDKAPVWLSTDLRDGNQALIEPMDASRKLRMFNTLLQIGFKEIEVGFPAASQTDFDFVRKLIDDDLIPDDVTIQVMTPAREELIGRTIESLAGARRAIVHIYNAVAPVWREVVFGLEIAEVMQLVQRHVGIVKTLTDAQPETEWVLQYSPETFSMAELEVSLQACETAIQAWGVGRPIILNLPTTVENATPNIFADQVEWMSRRLSSYENVTLSIHPHNDRGTGVAAAELALQAGAHRLEGCLFGNGERTGNLDLVNVALNLYTQGVNPQLDFSNIDEVRRTVEYCNQLPVHQRHPYAGDLVYTSFSGSHQDAIKKAFAVRKEGDVWAIPYLPIDPKDLGRSYEAVIRVNSQSGKGGISYLLETEFGLELPRRLQIEFSQIVQGVMDTAGKEFTAQDIHDLFEHVYGICTIASPQHRIEPLEAPVHAGVHSIALEAQIIIDASPMMVKGTGTGPIDAFVDGWKRASGQTIRVLDYHEHAIGSGAHVQAVAYIELRVGQLTVFGVGKDANIVAASLKAIISGLQRARTAAESNDTPQTEESACPIN